MKLLQSNALLNLDGIRVQSGKTRLERSNKVYNYLLRNSVETNRRQPKRLLSLRLYNSRNGSGEISILIHIDNRTRTVFQYLKNLPPFVKLTDNTFGTARAHS